MWMFEESVIWFIGLTICLQDRLSFRTRLRGYRRMKCEWENIKVIFFVTEVCSMTSSLNRIMKRISRRTINKYFLEKKIKRKSARVGWSVMFKQFTFISRNKGVLSKFPSLDGVEYYHRLLPPTKITNSVWCSVISSYHNTAKSLHKGTETLRLLENTRILYPRYFEWAKWGEWMNFIITCAPLGPFGGSGPM